METSYIENYLREETVRLSSLNYLKDTFLSYSVVDSGIVLPYAGQDVSGKTMGGVADSNGLYIDSSGLHSSNGCGYSVSYNSIIKKKKKAIFIGCWLSIWGHCLTDNISKLWFLTSAEGKKLIEDGAELVYVVLMKDRFKIQQSFIDLLKILNIDTDRIVEVTTPTQYNEVIVPDSSLIREEETIFYTAEYSNTIKSILRVQTSIKKNKSIYDKVYFSRSQLKKAKKDFGEKRVEDVFRFLGYKIIYPERHSFLEQLEILGNCSSFAATEGSIAHNSLFCKEGTKVNIVRKGDYLNNYQFAINHLKDLDVTYIDSNLSLFTNKDKVWEGPFFLYANNNLLRFAGIPLIFNSFTLNNFKEYVREAYPKNVTRLDNNEQKYLRLIEEVNMAFCSKKLIKRYFHWYLSRCNLSIWVPIYNMFIKR